FILPNANGCDSVVTLNLTILQSSASTDVVSVCQSYTWIDGVTYESSNNSATHILPNAAGCDSVITLDLTLTTIDRSVTISGATLSANQAGGNYQWIDCNNGNAPIGGANGQSYAPTENVTYAVVITIDNCSDTSECQLV